MSPNAVLSVIQIIVLLFSVVVHEVMHGVVALKFGDHTAEDAGRLTLNPLPHLDPIGSVLMPLLSVYFGGIFFAWAKPVPINPLNFTDIKKGEIAVSLAGIGANFSLALLGAVLYHITPQNSPFSVIFQIMVILNLILGIFNLIPIPPLDGSKVLMALLPYEMAREYMKLERYGFLILFALLLIPIGGQSLISLLLGSVIHTFSGLLGIPY